VYDEVTRLIPFGNRYNMNETGVEVGEEESARVIIDNRTSQTRYKTHPGRQEWISVVECICADGTAIPPCFIFKGETVNTNLHSNKIPGNWRVSNSKKGWTSTVHGLYWLLEDPGYSSAMATIVISPHMLYGFALSTT
jgi:hypothetical protein